MNRYPTVFGITFSVEGKGFMAQISVPVGTGSLEIPLSRMPTIGQILRGITFSFRIRKKGYVVEMVHHTTCRGIPVSLRASFCSIKPDELIEEGIPYDVRVTGSTTIGGGSLRIFTVSIIHPTVV